MNGKIEGVIVPGKFPLPEFGGQLALLVDAWVREWRACIGNVELTAGGVSLGQALYFRADTWEQLAADDAYQPHLRIQNHGELMGARKMLQRLLAGNPGAVAAIAHHLFAEGGGANG
ncbi:hypothetical protein BV98_002209 [Sphingobium herbicidovorans NBRC 16415]|uniref:Uncharacterized protein n=1 Tax=Sphingobium herbicidovorans (strain ATCC 700291 / DSM 11019 / CCUG 56400 / KCTC 2939 / LMG 18315 / NBRC 16415 / MH) TaxID=1219045 RepID=A0A086P9G8_SPHHM|nr:hypothetical protein [Sphingobium herbicidovorans]KFG90036.1 hypothetical protein BV98_002209 [Sphingobium herbicidovorans NBRC 16415]